MRRLKTNPGRRKIGKPRRGARNDTSTVSARVNNLDCLEYARNENGILSIGVVTSVPMQGIEWMIFLRNLSVKEKENDDSEL
jgi:hypothetical protein